MKMKKIMKMRKNSIFAALVVMMTSMTGLAQTSVTIHSQNSPAISVDAYDIEGFEFERVEEQTATIDEWIDLGLPSGLLWRSCNFEAGHPTASGASIPRQLWDNGGNDYIAGISGYMMRTPLEADIDELFDNCTVEKEEIEGVVGVKFTGTNGNSIFLPAAGIHYEDDSCLWKNMLGVYWVYGYAPTSWMIGVKNPDKYVRDVNESAFDHPLDDIYKQTIPGYETQRYCLSVRPVRDAKTEVIYDYKAWGDFTVGDDTDNKLVFELVAHKTPVISSDDDFVTWEISEGEEVPVPEAFPDFNRGYYGSSLVEPFRNWTITFTFKPNETGIGRWTSIRFTGKTMPYGSDGFNIQIRQAPSLRENE